MLKKIIAMTLAFCLMLSMLPARAQAAEVASGTCGDSTTWTLTEDGVLTISGTGEMYEFDSSSKMPWASYQDQILSLVVEEGVKALAQSAFMDCSNLVDVKLPDSLTRISFLAFQSCTSLKNIQFPNSLTEIGFAAFCSCESLERVDIPAGVTYIVDHAFDRCVALKDIVIPDGVKSLTTGVFSGCSALERVDLPAGITRIEERVFYNCTSLSEIHFAGTKAQWDAIEKEEGWDENTGDYTIIFSDSDTDGHDYVNGICTICGAYELAVLNGEVYEIYNAGQLYWFAAQVNSGENSLNGKLMADIVVNENVLNADGELASGKFRSWTPIGSADNGYSGSFDGNKKTISGLYFSNTSVDYVGLFGYTNSACQICDLGLVDSYLKGRNYVGGIVGYNFADVSRCFSAATVKGTNYVGGLAAVCDGNVNEYLNKDPGTVRYCYNVGKVSGDSYVGGLVGCVEYRFGNISCGGRLSYSYNIGEISGMSEVGSVAGSAYGNGAYCCYYLDGYYIGVPDCMENVFALTHEQFASGEAAYGMGQPFGQTIGVDSLPVLDGEIVYRNQTGGCCETNAVYVYSNTAADPVVEHTMVEPSCVQAMYCSACGVTEGEPLGHDYVETEKEATCTEGGYTESTCSRCGDSYIYDETGVLGHKWVDANCTTPKTCSVCGATEGEALGHNYMDGICTVCGEKYSLDLEYTLSDCGTYYIVSGIGTCEDSHVVIPATYNGLPVTTIGNWAFSWCEQLTGVTLPDSITTIEWDAFNWCYNMTNINIPDSVTAIYSGAFQGCQSLTSVFIPASVTFAGNGWFGYCTSLTEITVDQANPALCAVDGVLYKKDMSELLGYPAGKTDTSFVVPSTVTKIDSAAFEGCRNLSDITLPEGLLCIYDRAFKDCQNLQSIELPSTLTYIGDHAFDNCSSLTEVIIPASVTFLDRGAFAHCYGLHEILVEAGNSNYCTVDGVVYTADLKTLVYYPAGKQGASFAIPAGTEAIEGDAFFGVKNLKEITIPSSMTTISASAFEGFTGLTSVVIPDGVTRLEEWAFAICENLTSVTIPASVTYIGYVAFYYCPNLSTIYYGGTQEQWEAIVKEDGWDMATHNYVIYYQGACEENGHSWVDATCTTAKYCSACGITDGEALGHNYVDGACSVCGAAGAAASEGLAYTLSDCGTYYIVSGIGTCTATDVIIPNTYEGLPVAEIGHAAFWACTQLTSITIPASVRGISENVFENCEGLVKIVVEEDNERYCSVDGVLYTEDMSTLMWYPAAKADTSFVIPDGVVIIEQCAFRSCNNLRTVVIPEGVTSLVNFTFNYCANLTSISLPSTLTYIWSNAFCPCESLTDIYYAGTEEQWNAITKEDGWNLADWDGNLHSFTIHFQDNAEPEGQIYLESVEAAAGDTVTVNVYIQNNPGFIYANLTLVYDTSVLTLVSVENGELLDTMTAASNILWDASEDATEDGLLCTLVFQVSENAEEGQYVVNAIVNETYNQELESVSFAVTSAVVEVCNVIYGDANGDGKVNGKDLMLLRKYMANYNFSTGVSTVEVEAGADANGDGNINGKDLMLLRKYMANYDFTTGESTVVLGPTG